MVATGKKRLGLTIVELLAATALATMLVAAVLGVLNRVTQQQKVLLTDDAPEPWHNRIVDLLEWDLANSQTIRTTPDGIHLEGFASRDVVTGEPLHCPAVVSYLIVREGERSWLMRRETHPDALVLDNRTAELVCAGAERILATPPGAAAATSIDGMPSEAVSLADGALPARLKIVVYARNKPEPIFDHAFRLF